MIIYTFYSYKGGVGRSMALANVAERLYRDGIDVLIVDFDLEAPGLERYFADVLPKGAAIQTVQNHRGVVDMLLSYRELRSLAAPARPTLAEDAPMMSAAPALPTEPLANFLQVIYPKRGGSGSLTIMTAGRRDASNFREYARQVLAFDWTELYAKWDGEAFFEWFRNEMAAVAQVVLIDSRTGVTEITGVCTYQLADVVVSFVAANQQNQDGVLRMAESLTDKEMIRVGRKGRPLYQIFVPSRVEINEGVRAKEFQTRFVDAFHKAFPAGLPGQRDISFDLAIPYVPYFAFDEKVAVREADHPFAKLLLDPFQALVVAMARLDKTDSRMYRTYHSSSELLAKIAEEFYEEASAADRDQIRLLFGRLVRVALPGETAPDTAIAISLSTIQPSVDQSLIDKLVEERLLTLDTEPDGTTVRLRDDGVIGRWTRLVDWLNEDRMFLAWRQRMAVNLAEWQATRDTTDLLSGTPMSEAVRWIAERRPFLNAREIEFITESIRADEIRRQSAQEVAQTRAAATDQLERAGRKSQLFLRLATAAGILVLLSVWWNLRQTSAPAPPALLRSTAIVAAASASPDPLEKALLLSDLAGLPEPDGAQAVAQELVRLSVPRAELKGHLGPVLTVSVSPDGSRVVTGSDDHTARIWRTDGTGMPIVLSGHRGSVVEVMFSSNGALILTAGLDSTVRIWPSDGARDPIVLDQATFSQRLGGATFNRDGSIVATVSEYGTALLWDTAGHFERSFGPRRPADSDNMPNIVFNADGALLATSIGRIARVWFTNSSSARRPPILLSGHEGRVTMVAFNSAGDRLVTASDDRTARIWRVDAPGSPIVLAGHSAEVHSAMFSPSGDRVVTASADNTARIWNATDGRPLFTLRGHTGAVWVASFSPDSKQILTASADGTARLWNADLVGSTESRASPIDDQTFRVLRAGSGEIRSAVYSKDGGLVVTASTNGTARIWDAQPPAPLATLGWNSLTSYLKTSTTACLAPPQRARLLKESESEAQKGYESCELSHGRIHLRASEPSPPARQ
jgi:hypothetical protein